MSFTSLQKIIPKTLTTFGVRREVEAAHICQKYRLIAAELIHPDALQHTFPKFYRRRTLTIGVENPAWAHVVITKKSVIIEKINAALGKAYIDDLKTTISPSLPVSSPQNIP